MEVDINGKIITIPDDYDPRKDNDEYMNERQRAYFKIKLQNWLNDIKKKIKALQNEDIFKSSDGELASQNVENYFKFGEDLKIIYDI